MLDLLSRGAVASFVSGEKPEKPVLQILGIKKMDSSGTERYRLLLSDGEYTLATSMLATQLNHLVNENQIEVACIIQINKYQVSFFPPSKHVLVCLDVDIIKSEKEVGGKLGNPVSSNQISQNIPPPSSSTNQNNVTNNVPAPAMKSPAPSKTLGLNSANTPKTPGGSSVKVVPIASLTPYQNRWTIKVRVTQKGDMREWKNARGEGKLFSFTMVDESGDIRATAFKEDAEKFFDLIQSGKVYYVSNASLKPANQQYNNTSHDYEMTMRRESAIIPCEDADDNVPKMSYNFIQIDKLTGHINSMADVIGVVMTVEDVQSVMIRSQNRETKRRNISIMDHTGNAVKCTFWGDKAENVDFEGNPVVALKSVRVSDFSGCSLSTVASSMIDINPDIPQAFDLKQWYETTGTNTTPSNITQASSGGSNSSNWMTLAELNDTHIGMDDKPVYATVKATVLIAKKENILYQACPSDDCNKKVVDLQNGTYRCEKCNKDSSDFKYRMILNMNLADDSHSIWVTCFQDQGEKILNCSAKELGEMRESNEAAFDEIMKNVAFKTFMFQLRGKMDKYNDEERLRVVVMNVAPMSHETYARKLLADLNNLKM